MPTEVLAIKVTDNGSSRAVANEFKSMAREIMQAGKDLSAMKRQMKGFSGGFNGEVRKVNKELNKVGASTRKARSGIDRVSRSAKAAKGPLRSLASNMASLRGVAFSLGGVFAAGQFLNMSDQFQNMENRIKLVTNSTAEFNAVQSRLFAISKDTRQSVGATVETYVRLRKATKDSGVEAERLFGVMKTLNQMLAISGASSQETEQSMRQLSQAFSKGFLNGDEFRTVSEAMPDILDALQSSLGVTRGELRKMSEAGTLTTDVLLTAFEGVKDKVDGQFKGSIKTFGQSWQLLKDEVMKTVGELNKSTGIIGVVMGAMKLLANNLWLVVVALKALVLWAGVKLTSALLGAAMKTIPALITALTNARIAALMLSVALNINPLTLYIGAAVAGAAAIMTLAGAWGKAQDAFSNKFGPKSIFDGSDSLEESGRRQISHNELKIAALRKHAALESTFQAEKRQGQIEELQRRNSLHESQLKGIALARATAAEEKRVAEQLRMHKVAVTAANKEWDKMKAAIYPTQVAVEDLNQKMEKWLEISRLLEVSSLNVAAHMAFKASGDTDPIGTEITKRKELLRIAQITSDKERTRQEIRKEAEKTMIDALGAQVLMMERAEDFGGGFVPLFTPGQLAQVNEMVDLGVKLEATKKKSGGRPKVDNTLKELLALVSAMNPVAAAEKRMADATELFNKAIRKNIPLTKEMQAAMQELWRQTESARHPTAAIIEEMNQLLKTQDLSTDALARLNEETQRRNELLARGKGLSGDALKVFTESVDMLIAEEKAINAARKARESYNAVSGLEESRPGYAETFGHRINYKEMADLARAKSVVDRDSIQITNNLNGAVRELQQAHQDGNIDLATYNVLVAQARNNARDAKIATEAWGGSLRGVFAMLTDQAVEDMWINSVTNAFMALEDMAVASIIQIETALMDLATGATTDWDSFTTGMKDMFHDAAEAMLQDITRILIRLAAMRLIQGAMGGGVIPLGPDATINPFRHGGTINTANLPRFAHGGGMQVGGSGGPDTKLVQFMASPGENVRVTNPGQSRLDNRAAAAANANSQQAPVVNVINQMNPNDMVSAMSTPAGTKAVLNIIQQNGPVVKRTLR